MRNGSRQLAQRAGPVDVRQSFLRAPQSLALFLRRLHANDPIRNSVIQIFAPASEHGAPGVHELQQQTVSLLSCKSRSREKPRGLKP